MKRQCVSRCGKNVQRSGEQRSATLWQCVERRITQPQKRRTLSLSRGSFPLRQEATNLQDCRRLHPLPRRQSADLYEERQKVWQPRRLPCRQ
ncbi:hypothetical protein HPB50_008780 [Hyalomma asiaticum]|uniref:Uncharacterized protein n=1 Tax=Hyalomma asiaticum TaxID=266040 RepID=A0ACB7S4I7_HYAAI|nr:hypothetical protein HPB50_008780 [Hyalomma asiaticum]